MNCSITVVQSIQFSSVFMLVLLSPRSYEFLSPVLFINMNVASNTVFIVCRMDSIVFLRRWTVSVYDSPFFPLVRRLRKCLQETYTLGAGGRDGNKKNNPL